MEITTAIRLAGSINKLSAVMGVTRQVIQGWMKRGAMPADRIEELRAKRPDWFQTAAA